MTPSGPCGSRLVLSGVALLIGWGGAGTARAQAVPADRDEIIHVLNRVTFGPRPGDVEAVEKMGLQNYLEGQLHPETIDDSAVEARVGQLELLQMSQAQLTRLFSETVRRINETQRARGAANPQQGAPVATSPPANGQDQGPRDPPPRPEDLPWRPAAAVGQLEEAKLVRAIYSQRQLQEVLVDFWGNHFNIDVKKGPCVVWKVVDDRDVIRPHIWGRFRDLLEASAKSPAMLNYLDNAMNTVARSDDDEMMSPDGRKRPNGINENYAREIMELHTLGVDGGYTQKDVEEVARCFTGWTVERRTGEFAFHDWEHDEGAKVVLGHAIPAGGGMQDGETVLDILCASPACARFISRELCQRFVSDDPPPALVDRIAEVFQKSGGDLREVTTAILTSPEFLSPSDYGCKIKSPFEFAVSAVRATGATLAQDEPAPYNKIRPTREGMTILGRGPGHRRESSLHSLNWHIYDFGEPLFACTAPTGYTEDSKRWVSAGALIDRLNFALALSQNEVDDLSFDSSRLLGGIDSELPGAVLDRCIAALLQNKISDATRKVLQDAATPAGEGYSKVDSGKLIALIIGSPEFQRK